MSWRESGCPLIMTHFVAAGHGERHRYLLSGEDIVAGVDQRHLHLVLARWQPGYVDCVVVTGIRPPPGEVVDSDVQMPDAWRCLEGARPRTRVGCECSRLGTGPR